MTSIDDVKAEDEDRASFVREAVASEIKRRKKRKPGKGAIEEAG